MFLTLRHAFLVLCFALAVVACSRIDLAYRNLDVLVPWSLGDYLNMNRQQKAWLDQRLKQHLTWHCQTQLPGYLAWLDQIRRMVADDQVTDQALRQRTDEARQAIARVAEAITPSATELLRGMSDDQVKEMSQAFRDDIRKRQAQYDKTPLPKQVSERAQRMEERLEPWFGELNAPQRLRVLTWSQALGDQNGQRIANRAHWQQQLVQVLAQRDTPAFEPRLAQLLQRKESLWTPEYRIAFQRSEQQARNLLVDLVRQSTPGQRQHLLARLAKVRSDFTELKCMKG
ncbi:DUF6279 family lipoprotein [Pseudomonas guariconensis]|uniref:DUF6279 family lipoprotein n=1 Tax=Pseudomonas guariconensis TaxID=1288410 RepID=UPI0018A8C184|nr:DUF6279 family lipoprotein [Pseudomonas guariconensis]MBF8723662.1 hypothetical protein [Pseudomonas guariconensis]MBF8794967.1 hypothetical protein [Pseudomonas monteilii]